MSTNQITNILTPVCRIVEGSVHEAKTTDAEGNPLVVKSGPNAGQSRVDYYFAVAIPKNDPKYGEIWAAIYAEARKGFPSLFDAAGNCIKPTFAWKVTDGDSQVPNAKNKKPCDKEGFPGHWVLRFSGGFAPKCYTEGGAHLIPENEVKDRIKCGYYVRVYGSVKSNESVQQPGIYLNHIAVEFVAYGEEITYGPDGAEIFGGTPVGTLPQGASNIPFTPQTSLSVGTPGAMPAGMPTGPMPGAMPAGMPTGPMPGAMPAGAPTIPQFQAPPGVQPAHGFHKGPGVPPPAAPPSVVKYILNGVAYPEADLRAAGYTDAHFATLQKA